MKKTFCSLVLLALLLLPARWVHAFDGRLDGRVIIGQSFTLKSGETLGGDLVVIGGQAIVEKNAAVQGDVIIIGGSLQLNGQISGDAVVIGGAASIGEQASLTGDVITLGGSLQRAEGARIGGNIITNLPPPSFTWPNASTVTAPPVAAQPNFRFDFGPLGRAAALFMQALGLTALAMLLTALLHPQLDRVAQAASTQPFMAGSMGLLTAVLAPLAVVVLAVTLVLIPVALAVIILLVLAWLFGVVALGMLLGERVMLAAHRTWEPVLSAGIGTFALALAVGTMNLVPCIGWLASALVGLVGLGAAVMTLFGTRPEPNAALTLAPANIGNAAPPPAS